MKYPVFILLFFFNLIFGQNGLQIPENTSQIKIPFRLINNLIFIESEINGIPMTLLLDTGVSETIIFSIEEKEITLKNTEKINFTGLGEGTETQGLVSKKNKLEIGKLLDNSHTLYIILNTDFNFSSQIGIPVNGIIGYDFFENHPVKIDYQKKRITLYKDRVLAKRKTKNYQEIPISIENNKPYLEAQVQLKSDNKKSKLLIDTGNSDALWLFPNKIENFQLGAPFFEDYLGRGFNGDIHGKKSRISTVNFGSFMLNKTTVSLPDDEAIKSLNLVTNRVGSVGDEILKRFDVVFDYKNQKIYLKKNKDFDDPYHFNMSGLEFKHQGMQWEKIWVSMDEKKHKKNEDENAVFSNFQYKFQLKPVFAIAACRPNSPADQSGLKKDDIILAINGKPASNLSLQDLINLMKSEEGKEIFVTISRNEKKMDFSFILKDPIPISE
ncbi:aspartyl protease family protein [Amniculibacterium aquaticum]|uniref:aspartyl protease family protein n=1 Tax=Amniculibacterium aquaticum TaxID=2479858 RepID=UPI000F5B2F4D|nr:aspartyl protease family protein [Amniculibacterium aquaticum]